MQFPITWFWSSGENGVMDECTYETRLRLMH